MKKLLFVLCIILICAPLTALSEETVSESMQDMKSDAQRETNQKLNRIEEET